MEFPKRIMIVEDEVITQRFLKNILGQYDMDKVECYDNAKDALGHIRKGEYDIILMDINIKGTMDGIQLSREILRNHTIPIIFITAHNDEETFDEVLDLSPYGFVSKPFSAKDIEMSIKLAYKRYRINSQTISKEESKIKNQQTIIISEKYMYSMEEKRLYKDDSIVKLNFKQNKLIEILCSHVNHIVDYNTIILEIWGNEVIADSALRTLIYTVRKAHPDLPIVSHSKVGYSLHIEK